MNPAPTAARILIVDDDVGHADSVHALLATAGYRVEIAAGGSVGLDRLRAADVDILILDLNMPGVSGVEVLDRLGRSGAIPKTIVLSGESDISQVAPVLRLGAYDYLPKPYDPGQLLSSVRHAAERCALEQERNALAAEREIQNRRHAFLVNASPDLIYLLDASGRITFHNDHLRDVFGFERDSAVGLHWREVVPPAVHEAVSHRVDERRTGDRATRHMAVDLPLPEQGMRALELSAVGVYDGAKPDASRHRGTYGVVRDVTEVRRANLALAQSQEKFSALFYNSPDAVFISRLADGRILEGNANFRRIVGGDASINVDSDAVVWGSQAARAAFIERLLASPQRHSEQLTMAHDAGARTFEVTARVLELDGDTCIVGSVRDLSAQLQAERDRLNLETKLQQASKMEAIGQLAGGIAHDFNNILASIIGYTELVIGASPHTEPTQIRSYLGEVVSAGQRARDLISQMLTFTRAHQGHAVLTDVRVAIGEVSRMLRAAIPRTIDIHNEFADVEQVRIDPVQLQQVVINLLVNARDAISGNGRIALRVAESHADGKCVACDTPLAGRFVELTVSDTGHGIAREVLPRVFDMFVSTREPGRGTGMGLWLVNTIVHEHGGHVQVDTGERGTTFHVFLPLGSAAAQMPVPEPLPQPASQNIGGHILVVDDEVSVGNFIGEVLRNAGYDAVVYSDAAAAIDHLTRRAEDVSVVLTDFAMPQFSGLDVAEAARATDRQIPVVIVTGFADRADKTRMARLGVARLLTKPFRIEALLAAVREVTVARSVATQSSTG